MKLTISITLLLVLSFTAHAQMFGPNNPSIQNTITPGNNWGGSTTGTFFSDNSYTTISTPGLSRTLRARDYGFSLTSTDIVTGIQLDIERKTDLGANVALIGPWRDGQLSNIPNYALPAGNNRMMLVFVGAENGNEPIISSLTYGGMPMIRATGFSYSTTFWARLECWYLPESSLASLAPGNYNIQVNYTSLVNNEFFDIISAAVFSNVDQSSPFLSFEQRGINGGGAASQLSNPISATVGGMYVTGIFSGNPPTPAVPNGGTNTFTINSGFTEGTDVHRANAGASTSGGCMQTAYKIPTVSGTENPTFTFNGTPNRRLMIGIGLRKVSAFDVEVTLQKNGVTVGTNYAQNGVAWPLTDTYASYGGPGDLWGTTWSYTDVNNAQFAGQLRVNIVNGTAQIDHMRMIVYSTSVLPVELIDFYATRTEERRVKCNWITASERNNSHFVVERSSDGSLFEEIGMLNAAGTSNEILTYEMIDENPLQGLAYYRLKQVDFDGQFSYSQVRKVDGSVSDAYTLYPNPASNWATLTAIDKNVSISIVTSDGRIIDSAEGYFFEENYHFNLSSEPDGTYYVIINHQGEKTVKKMVKESR